MAKWLDILTAPKDGSRIRIRGRRFKTLTWYRREAIWTKRRCPYVEVEGWFPPTDLHDRQGPYEDVTHWKPVEDQGNG